TRSRCLLWWPLTAKSRVRALLRVLRGTGHRLLPQVLPPPQHQGQPDQRQRGAALRRPHAPAAAHLDGEGGPRSQPGPAPAGPAGPEPAPHRRDHQGQGRQPRTLPGRRARLTAGSSPVDSCWSDLGHLTWAT
ncbi:unnamed protein product, partial [Tetraodon nigroviridis]